MGQRAAPGAGQELGQERFLVLEGLGKKCRTQVAVGIPPPGRLWPFSWYVGGHLVGGHLALWAPGIRPRNPPTDLVVFHPPMTHKQAWSSREYPSLRGCWPQEALPAAQGQNFDMLCSEPFLRTIQDVWPSFAGLYSLAPRGIKLRWGGFIVLGLHFGFPGLEARERNAGNLVMAAGGTKSWRGQSTWTYRQAGRPGIPSYTASNTYRDFLYDGGGGVEWRLHNWLIPPLWPHSSSHSVSCLSCFCKVAFPKEALTSGISYLRIRRGPSEPILHCKLEPRVPQPCKRCSKGRNVEGTALLWALSPRTTGTFGHLLAPLNFGIT